MTELRHVILVQAVFLNIIVPNYASIDGACVGAYLSSADRPRRSAHTFKPDDCARIVLQQSLVSSERKTKFAILP
jgi:hypothetical protein